MTESKVASANPMDRFPWHGRNNSRTNTNCVGGAAAALEAPHAPRRRYFFRRLAAPKGVGRTDTLLVLSRSLSIQLVRLLEFEPSPCNLGTVAFFTPPELRKHRTRPYIRLRLGQRRLRLGALGNSFTLTERGRCGSIRAEDGEPWPTAF